MKIYKVYVSLWPNIYISSHTQTKYVPNETCQMYLNKSERCNISTYMLSGNMRVMLLKAQFLWWTTFSRSQKRVFVFQNCILKEKVILLWDNREKPLMTWKYFQKTNWDVPCLITISIYMIFDGDYSVIYLSNTHLYQT